MAPHYSWVTKYINIYTDSEDTYIEDSQSLINTRLLVIYPVTVSKTDKKFVEMGGFMR